MNNSIIMGGLSSWGNSDACKWPQTHSPTIGCSFIQSQQKADNLLDDKDMRGITYPK